MYMDDRHSRGSDLKFMRTAKAAVTIGKGMTKDKLLQAVMRMRQLGEGQTVVFWGTSEITSLLLAENPNLAGDHHKITSQHIMAWTMGNTSLAATKGVEQWAGERLRYLLRKQVKGDGFV